MLKFLHEFINLPNGEKIDNGWWQIDGNLLVNIQGAHHEYIPNEDDIIVEAESLEDIDCKFLLVPDSRFGWVAPDGTFYGCEFSDHSLIARLVFKSDEQTLEKTHVKIYGYERRTEAYTRRPFLTEQQTKTLKERGIAFCYTDNGVVDFDDDEVEK